MENLYFFAVAIVLYVISNKILDVIEQKRGQRFENRTVIFFFIILSLAIVSFWVIRHLASE